MISERNAMNNELLTCGNEGKNDIDWIPHDTYPLFLKLVVRCCRIYREIKIWSCPDPATNYLPNCQDFDQIGFLLNEGGRGIEGFCHM